MKRLKILSIRNDPYIDTLFFPEQWKAYVNGRLLKIAPEIAMRKESVYIEGIEYWKKYFSDVDYRWIDFYADRTKQFDIRYVPDDVYYIYIDPILNQPRRAREVDDKLLYELYFPEIRQPETVLRIVNGRILAPNWEMINIDDAIEICCSKDDIVFKKVYDSCGGSGVAFCKSAEVPTLLNKIIKSGENYIIQNKADQHRYFKALNPSSLNTIRIMSLLRANGEIVIISVVVRVGCPGMLIDNVSSGGCTIGVTNDGRLKDVAYSDKGIQLNELPSGAKIPAGSRLPCYQEMLDCVRSMHMKFLQHRLIAWDLSVTPTNDPMLIEMNLYKAEIDFMQINNGPLFGSYTEEIIEEVCNGWGMTTSK